MKKVVAFIGSPRKNGNTATLVAEVVKGAEAAGAQVKVFPINEMNIRPCQSCFSCRKQYGCPIDDDMKSVYEEIKQADAVVIGSPVYMLQVAGQVKVLFDRLFPLMDANFSPRCGIKKTVMIYSQGQTGADSFKASFDLNASVLQVMGLEVAETIVCTGANRPDTAAGDVKLLQRAYAAGRKLAE